MIRSLDISQGSKADTFLFLSDTIKHFFFSILNEQALTLEYLVCARHHANNFITVINDVADKNHDHLVLILGQPYPKTFRCIISVNPFNNSARQIR